MAAATLVLDGGCAAILLDELEAVGELDGELPQATTHSDTPHTKISRYFTVPRPSYGWQTAYYLCYEGEKIKLTLSSSN